MLLVLPMQPCRIITRPESSYMYVCGESWIANRSSQTEKERKRGRNDEKRKGWKGEMRDERICNSDVYVLTKVSAGYTSLLFVQTLNKLTIVTVIVVHAIQPFQPTSQKLVHASLIFQLPASQSCCFPDFYGHHVFFSGSWFLCLYHSIS